MCFNDNLAGRGEYFVTWLAGGELSVERRAVMINECEFGTIHDVVAGSYRPEGYDSGHYCLYDSESDDETEVEPCTKHPSAMLIYLQTFDIEDGKTERASGNKSEEADEGLRRQITTHCMC